MAVVEFVLKPPKRIAVENGVAAPSFVRLQAMLPIAQSIGAVNGHQRWMVGAGLPGNNRDHVAANLQIRTQVDEDGYRKPVLLDALDELIVDVQRHAIAA